MEFLAGPILGWVILYLATAAYLLRRHLDREATREEERTPITALVEEVGRLDRLVDDLLAFARPDRRSRTRASLAMVADQAIFGVVSGLTDAPTYEIVRAIAEDHEGRVEIDNRPGKGATFWMHLCSEERPSGRPADGPAAAQARVWARFEAFR